MSADLSAWVGIGLTALAMTGGAIAYSHALVRQQDDRTEQKFSVVNDRIRLSDEKAEVRVAEAKRELEADLDNERRERVAADDAERDERRREQDRLGNAIDSFRGVQTMVATMVESVRHLGERFEDHRASNAAALDEIKHGMRNLDMKVQALPGASTAARRVRRAKGES